MTDTAPPSGTPSTPEPSGTPAPVDAASSATPPTSSTPPADAAPPAQATPPAEAPAEPVKPADPPADPAAPLFKLPDDFKLRPEGQQKFETVIKGKLKDGVVSMSPQDVVDLFVEQARDSYTAWQTQAAAQDQAWQSESQARFTKTQLAAAETGVGFLSSFEPAFRELVKGFSNHPAFVNAMRVIGERLSEDTFEIEGARPQLNGKAAKDVLYPNRN